MEIYTAQQIKSWDAYTIDQEPIRAIQLMERAAAACFYWLKENLLLLGYNKKPIKIFCGKGNNGGDGLAIARMLIIDHYSVKVYILDTGNEGTADFENNLQQLRSIPAEISFISDAKMIPLLEKEELVIDAIFGTGLKKPVEGLSASIIQFINQSEAAVVSVDIPSGMYADKSSKTLLTIKARHTLSFQSYKTCFLLAENEEVFGKVYILDIGLHEGFRLIEPARFVMIDIELLLKMYQPKKQFAHKGTYGHALLVAGSYGKMGAALLAARACLRSGVGLLTVHVPETGYTILQSAVPEAMAITGETIDMNKYASTGIGPGLNTNEVAVSLVTGIIQNIQSSKNELPAENSQLVVDADALNILSAHPSLLLKLPASTILTPHPKEFERLFGKAANDFERMEMAMQKAAEFHCYIILKGHHSFVATPYGKGYFNNTGNAGMAKGGSGDVLTGILTGLAAQGYAALETCLLGVYLHGLAGDIAAAKLSQETMLPSDIINCLSEAFRTLQIKGKTGITTIAREGR